MHCYTKKSFERQLYGVLTLVLVGFSTFIPNVLAAQFVIAERNAAYYYNDVKWKDTLLAEGVIWKRAKVDNFFEAPQSFNAVYIDPQKSNLIPHIAYRYTLYTQTSELTEELNGLVGINASFYSTETRKPVSWTVVKSRLQSHTQLDLASHFYNGAVRFNQLQDFNIIPPPTFGWYLIKPDSNVLSSGPLMILEGEDVAYPKDNSFILNRHPRTAIGMLEDGKILLLTVDGRHEQAEGLSIPELHSLMREMGCYSALNLDGGGSTTMALNIRDSVQVVNYPSDNKQFDHQGERAVINALVFAPPPPVYVEKDSLYIKY